MFSGSLSVFTLAIVVMCAIIGLGVVGGLLIAKSRERRYLKVFNEDVAKPVLSPKN
jgi:uncharacterized protein YneF (UPF0154 family)